MKRTITLIIVIFIILTTAGFVCAKTGIVNTQGLNFRENASTSSTSMMKIDKDANVNILGEEDSWYKISYDGKTGYVSKQYVDIKQDDDNDTTTGTVNTDTNITSKEDIKTVTSAVVYVLPLLNSTKITTLEAGKQVTLISVVGKWAYIQTDSVSGWLISSKLNSTVIASESGNSNINTVQNENAVDYNEVKTPENNTFSENNTNTEENNNTTSTSENATQSGNTSSEDVKFPATMYVNVDAVYVRSEADKTSKAVTSVGKNTPVTVTGKSGEWYKVEVSDGKGYIMSQFLSLTK